jgi:hypothetical protein
MSYQNLPYWKALAAFALSNEQVLANQEWRSQFPDVYEHLDSLMGMPPPVWGKVLIPGPMLVEMAKYTRLLFATDGKWLISTIDRVGIPPGYEEISALEALERYGLESVFEAADKASSRIG